MKISLNTIKWLNRYYHTSGDVTAIGVDRLLEKIGTQLGGIEEVIYPGKLYVGIVIAKVIGCSDHPSADRLHVCLIDDGGVVQNVPRNEQGYVQVVCGAPNVREGLLVAWLPPGSTVPESIGKQPIVLSARDIRGQVSQGVLASPRELRLSDDHTKILEIDGDYRPGTDFAEAFELSDDVVIDIENKMFTHRPDCFGFIGIARELAGIQELAFTSPSWYRLQPDFPGIEVEELPLEFRNELPQLVRRFTAVVLRDVQVKSSPAWLQIELAKVGLRSINNIVDYTNLYMLQTGQPLHAYDYDKVKALSGDRATIVVREPKPGESLKLLNGKTIKPRADAIMIATDMQLIGVGGVMGGNETEVDDQSHNIILECANFDMYSVRRTAMGHGLFTDAVTRFGKGQSPLQNLAVLAKITDDIRRHAGGKVASQLLDDSHLDQSVTERGSLHPPVTVSSEFVNVRLGLNLPAEEMKKLLENVECQVSVQKSELTVKAPFWRTDIELREDVVEEVGRLHGYDKLPLKLPKRDIQPAPSDQLFSFKEKARRRLSRAGANEVLTYSFVPGDMLDKVGQDKSQAFQLSNALRPELQYFRLSLTPSLLDKVYPNIKAGYDEFALFEIGKSHLQSDVDPDGLPAERQAIGLVFASKASQPAGAAYYQARHMLLYMLSEFLAEERLSLEPLNSLLPLDKPWLQQLSAPFAPKRSAVLRDDQGSIWGVVGEFKASVRQALKLPERSAGFEIDPTFVLNQGQIARTYTPLPRFPKVEQDISLRLPLEVPYQQLYDLVSSEVSQLKPSNSHISLSPLDIYQPQDSSLKHITLRLSIASYERTLIDKEVNDLLDQVAEAAKAKFGAERL